MKTEKIIIKTSTASTIEEVAKELISLKFKDTYTLKQCREMFYKIMRKHGIKVGTPSFREDGEHVGMSCNNFEWTMCKMIFVQMMGAHFSFDEWTGKLPKDLQQYSWRENDIAKEKEKRKKLTNSK